MNAHPTEPGVPTTHTLEMNQVTDLNSRLSNTRAPRIIAAELGVSDAGLIGHAADRLGAEAVLTRVSWQGSPGFPEVHGHFDASGGSVATTLHTDALRQISRRLLLRQRWGV